MCKGSEAKQASLVPRTKGRGMRLQQTEGRGWGAGLSSEIFPASGGTLDFVRVSEKEQQHYPVFVVL